MGMGAVVVTRWGQGGSVGSELFWEEVSDTVPCGARVFLGCLGKGWRGFLCMWVHSSLFLGGSGIGAVVAGELGWGEAGVSQLSTRLQSVSLC